LNLNGKTDTIVTVRITVYTSAEEASGAEIQLCNERFVSDMHYKCLTNRYRLGHLTNQSYRFSERRPPITHTHTHTHGNKHTRINY